MNSNTGKALNNEGGQVTDRRTISRCGGRLDDEHKGVTFMPYKRYVSVYWAHPKSSSNIIRYIHGQTSRCTQFKINTRLFRTNVLNRDIKFNISSNDVIVFLHIQKTGGTIFGRHLVQHLEHQCNCSNTSAKRCDCFRPSDDRGIWLFSKFSTGWTCGVHADWTALNSCVQQVLNRREKAAKKRRYLYITQLRDPTTRYLSEWRHVKRGATWPSKHMCDGRLPTSQEVPLCYKGENWIGVVLDQFLDCKWNMANNRQTRMLADLTLVGCYNLTKMPIEDRNWLMLESARRNLRRLAYFGLTEYQAESQYLFEQTFGMKFTTTFEQLEETHASRSAVTPEQVDRITKLNFLDVELYEYAKTLFLQRLEFMRHKSSTNNVNQTV
ncbi:heparan-sulfate 6-O-sulfotransferase 2-like [Amphiura filiformis]|uniref:heparan-sulfate 6-O-sulfotransferase 2-like n=1 Tax=Amphiura filiformis TaxID=82378 RepID=UPI003B221417